MTWREDNKHHQGVGLLLSSHANHALLGYECINERFLTAKFQTSIKDLNVICCYAPTEDADEDEKDRFYEQLQDILNSVKKGDITLALGDFNAKVATDSALRGGVMALLVLVAAMAMGNVSYSNSSSRGYYRSGYGHLSEYSDSSTFVRMQQHYWATKQAVFKKLGKKEDDCIVASDSELDTKLTLFQTIEESCLTLMRVLENYQDRLCGLAQEENAMGRFLKESGKQDKTRAGKMMAATGKTLSYSAQQRLSLRVPLIRLYQEVETFQYRAIVDTLQTVDKMEKSRTAYRGALMWMKDVSQQLDPDTYKQLEKFRKVQSHVKKSKMRFDKLKLDSLQKIDLLAASRCNMFSHVLATYQNTLLQFWKKTAQTMTSVAETFKGYQHYEFSMLKELTEPSKKLAEETSSQEKAIPIEDDKDAILFFDAEYHDEDESDDKKEKANKREKSASMQNLYDSPSSKSSSSSNRKNSKKKKNKSFKTQMIEKQTSDVPLLNLDEDTTKLENHVNDSLLLGNQTLRQTVSKEKKNETWTKDLLTDNPEVDDFDKDDLTLLNEILNAPCGNIPVMTDADDSFASQWQATFGNQNYSPEKSPITNETEGVTTANANETSETAMRTFLPSQLLDMNSDFKLLHLNSEDSLMSNDLSKQKEETVPNTTKSLPAEAKSRKGKQDMSAWFNLFADLDPLANPDLIGKKKDGHDDRNC